MLEALQYLQTHLETVAPQRRLLFVIDDWDMPLIKAIESEYAREAFEEHARWFPNALLELDVVARVYISGTVMAESAPGGLIEGVDASFIRIWNPTFTRYFGVTGDEFATTLAPRFALVPPSDNIGT